ncbi:Tetratricopeptide repeat protein 27 [Trichinella papuae]|uniref:Tetratricopeptide repeat protein 27 n=1 Tax=Trichinella papuae TaxID=268474 RepID=A0A0V1MA33_9BILA|nr:Tetratricopeptide repeat protein 27 [Trichinella papuae]
MNEKHVNVVSVRDFELASVPQAFSTPVAIRDLDRVDVVQKCYGELVANAGEQLLEECFKFGVNCLLHFVEQNFLGPPCDLSSSEFAILRDSTSNNLVCEEYLACDGEEAYLRCRYPILLLISKQTFVDCFEYFVDKFPTTRWWALRVLSIWQSLFRNRQNKIKKILEDQLKPSHGWLTYVRKFDTSLRAQLSIEIANICSFYFCYEQASEMLRSAMLVLRLNVRLTGKYGRRTYHQPCEVPQLVLDVCSAEDSCAEAEEEALHVEALTGVLPKNLPLEDDNLLDQLKLLDVDEKRPLTALEQCAISAQMGLWEAKSARSPFSQLELSAYLREILKNPRCWSVQAASLYKRSSLEKGNMKTVERALRQIGELVHCFYGSGASAQQRFPLFFATSMPPIWQFRVLNANLLLSLGCVKDALQDYLDLDMVDMVVQCYNRLDLKEQCEKYVRSKLEVKETPALLCHLADITEDEECYVKAWRLSGERYARAQFSLAKLYFKKQLYEQTIEACQKAATIQPLEFSTWYLLGYVSLQAKNFSTALQAYGHCVLIEPDHAEAWNNFAVAALELKEEDRAYRVLKEALRCSYEDKRIWKNFTLVSVRVGRVMDAIEGYHKLVDLGVAVDDMQILGTLVKLCNDADLKAKFESTFRRKLCELFGRLTSQKSNCPELWRLYSELYNPDHVGMDCDLEKYCKLCERAFYCRKKQFELRMEFSSAAEVLEYAVNLAKSKLRLATHLENGDLDATAVRMSAKIACEQILNMIKKEFCMEKKKQNDHDTVDEVMFNSISDLQALCTQL